MSKLVSVALLNWNGKTYLKDCIDAVLKQTYPAVELIVVDNASTDGSQDFLKETYKDRLTLIENSDNIGFSRGMNAGIRATGGDYVIPLNFDVVMEPDFIKRMVAAADKFDRVGSVTGKLLRFGDGGPTKTIDSVGHLIYNNRYAINIGEDTEDTGQFDTPTSVFGTCGAVPLYRKEMLDDTAWEGEYYDESFFIMLEDLDLDWRAQLRGWMCVSAPDAVAYHYRGAAGAGKSRLVQRHYYKNRYLMMWKNDTFGSVLRSLPAIWLMETYLHLDLLFTSPAAMLLGWYDLARLLPLTLRKRRLIQKGRVTAPSEIETWFVKYKWSTDVKRKLGLGGRQ